MNLYVGNYWVPFPSSEYGGSWVVIAENEGQCVDLLREVCYYGNDYEEEISVAVAKAQVFEVSGLEAPRIVDTFFT